MLPCEGNTILIQGVLMQSEQTHWVAAQNFMRNSMSWHKGVSITDCSDITGTFPISWQGSNRIEITMAKKYTSSIEQLVWVKWSIYPLTYHIYDTTWKQGICYWLIHQFSCAATSILPLLLLHGNQSSLSFERYLFIVFFLFSSNTLDALQPCLWTLF